MSLPKSMHFCPRLIASRLWIKCPSQLKCGERLIGLADFWAAVQRVVLGDS
jgi:hypothetical protein